MALDAGHRRPADLTEQEGCAYDVAYALTAGGVLPEPCYALAVKLFGQHAPTS